MEIIGKKSLALLARKHADARNAVSAWVAEVETAAWKNTADIKTRYPHASFLANNNVVFNIRGNNYRIIVVVVYICGQVIVKFAGTHDEYERYLKKGN
ncbi:MAG: type II toxin-antitoxin system HigB family toxin [Victivallales bacterium]